MAATARDVRVAVEKALRPLKTADESVRPVRGKAAKNNAFKLVSDVQLLGG